MREKCTLSRSSARGVARLSSSPWIPAPPARAPVPPGRSRVSRLNLEASPSRVGGVGFGSVIIRRLHLAELVKNATRDYRSSKA